ncbi:MAG: hypothetical protein QOF51_3890 [Chloroflexota bacterium]|jgi:hypothetical protein|nr:hypothetical protein [Chloroflexota bacterium]
MHADFSIGTQEALGTEGQARHGYCAPATG